MFTRTLELQVSSYVQQQKTGKHNRNENCGLQHKRRYSTGINPAVCQNVTSKTHLYYFAADEFYIQISRENFSFVLQDTALPLWHRSSLSPPSHCCHCVRYPEVLLEVWPLANQVEVMISSSVTLFCSRKSSSAKMAIVAVTARSLQK